MGLFTKKSKTGYISPALVDECKRYVDQHIVLHEKPEEAKANTHQIRYSLAEPAYIGDQILDMKRFMNDARRDTALFDSPALQNTYHEWEKHAAKKSTFSSEVLKRIDELSMKPADFYKAAELDKRVFHSLKNDYLYTPSKTTAIRCCFGLRLKYDEAIDLLKLAGYSFSPSNPQELVIRFCLEHELYDLPSVNYLLVALGEHPLS